MNDTIDLNKFVEMDNGMDALPCYPVLQGNYLICSINQAFPNPNDGRSKRGHLLKYNLRDKKVEWLIEIDGGENNSISTQPKIHREAIYLATYSALYSIDFSTGGIVWKRNFKATSFPKISILSDRLLLSNWGELFEIDIHNQKALHRIKPRIKWFDSEVIEYKNRWFVTTSNAKILEINLNNLGIQNEYRFPGGWATGVEPLFYEDLLISSNYGGKIIIVDLNSNKITKQLNKKSGSEPRQWLFKNYTLFYEGNIGQVLTRYDLPVFKKKWSVEINRVQYISQSESGNLEIIFKANDKFVVGTFDENSGDLLDITVKSNYSKWQLVPFDCWHGISIQRNELFSVYAFEPNKLIIKYA